jgi:hypothetical protein
MPAADAECQQLGFKMRHTHFASQGIPKEAVDWYRRVSALGFAVGVTVLMIAVEFGPQCLRRKAQLRHVRRRFGGDLEGASAKMSTSRQLSWVGASSRYVPCHVNSRRSLIPFIAAASILPGRRRHHGPIRYSPWSTVCKLSATLPSTTPGSRRFKGVRLHSDGMGTYMELWGHLVERRACQ